MQHSNSKAHNDFATSPVSRQIRRRPKTIGEAAVDLVTSALA